MTDTDDPDTGDPAGASAGTCADVTAVGAAAVAAQAGDPGAASVSGGVQTVRGGESQAHGADSAGADSAGADSAGADSAGGDGSGGDGSGGDGSGSGDRGGAEFAAVRALVVAVDRVWQALGARSGMGLSEIVTLEALHARSPLSTGEVRERTGLSPGAVTALLDRFEARGLAQRIRPRHNRRVVLIDLTAEGHELCAALFTSLAELVEQGIHDPGLPELAVRVQCLRYTATLLDRAAGLLTETH